MKQKLIGVGLGIIALIGAILFLVTFEAITFFWDDATNYEYNLLYSLATGGQWVITLAAFVYMGWNSYKRIKT